MAIFEKQSVLLAALDRWAAVAVAESWTRKWLPGAIFPTEMAFFLARCEAAGVRTIFESGRQDGYSTGILAQYAQAMQGRAISIDVEGDPLRAEACRQRLGGERRLTLLKGNAAHLLGPLISGEASGPAAVLVDGPKHYYALSLLFACAGYDNVALLAMHNLNPDLAIRRYFQRFGAGPYFYEEINGDWGDAWHQLHARELEQCCEQDNRFLGTCCLGVMDVPAGPRWRYWLGLRPRFGRRQPLRYFARWRLAEAA